MREVGGYWGGGEWKRVLDVVRILKSAYSLRS